MYNLRLSLFNVEFAELLFIVINTLAQTKKKFQVSIFLFLSKVFPKLHHFG